MGEVGGDALVLLPVDQGSVLLYLAVSRILQGTKKQRREAAWGKKEKERREDEREGRGRDGALGGKDRPLL